ncbi:MAG: hypothetical protein COA57_04445 [Flavobacteriales bacterium]|nr:MAG: hypothetical protein COA57_04445 [Flavobacteriales bacterium]
METKYKAVFAAMLSVGFCLIAIAQQQEPQATDGKQQFYDPIQQSYARGNDLELLMGFNIDKKFSKKFEAGLNYQTRLNNVMSSFKAALVEGSLQYNLNKFVSFKTAFRQAWVAETDFHGWYSGTGTRQRILFATYLKWKKKDFPLRLQGRLRIENEWASSNGYVTSYTFLRPRLNIEYNVCKLVDPYVSVEPFFNMRAANSLGLMRFEAGLQWRVGKVAGLNTFYRLEAVNDFYKSKIHVMGLVWDFKFK